MTRYNESFIELLDKLNEIMLKRGEAFRARAYSKAQETIMTINEDITSVNELKGKANIGATIIDKLNEFVKTGTLSIIEEEKNNPVNIFTNVYGIGPKKAQELVSLGVKTIEQLRLRQSELLNDKQIIGLQYYEDILQRIPRDEIQQYENILLEKFGNNNNINFEIVGSYRRGANNSGDIDIIITSSNPKDYERFVDVLIQCKLIVEVLSRGPSKTLVIAKLLKTGSIARRVDFLYSPPYEFAFAILYFTGSKIFNTVMRQHALDNGYTFNEHGIYKLENKQKGDKVIKQFKTEKDIFDFLGLQFKTPSERTDGRAVVKIYAKVETISVVGSQNPLEKFVELFRKNGVKLLEKMTEAQLSQVIVVANKHYYNETPILTDAEYDIIRDYIEEKYPSNQSIKEIGAEVTRNKVKLPFTLFSMKKIKPDTSALNKWLLKYTNDKVISWKLDGVSGLYYVQHQHTELKLFTRGDGFVGQDVKHFAPHLNLPFIENVAIRGEFVIRKDVFKDKYSSKYANSRNMVAGIFNNKIVVESIKDVHFVAYEVIYPVMKPSDQMKFIESHGFECVPYILKPSNQISNEMLSDLLVEWRQNPIYQIDGSIVTDDAIYARKDANPEHSFAFKMVLSDQCAEAYVSDVIWTPSKDGLLKPRIRINPIVLGDVTIEFATGFNAKFICDNKIGVGSMVKIIRSGDVIPHIVSVTQSSEEPLMPNVPYTWNETGVDIILENPEDNQIVKEKNITGFFRCIGVEGLSNGIISRLMNFGYDSVPSILRMNVADYLKVDGFKTTLANKIHNGIADKVSKASLITLMTASNKFGHGFSEKKMELILNELPDILISKETDEEKITAIEDIKGMGRKTAEAFVAKIGDFITFLKECNLEDRLYVEPDEEDSIEENEFNGKTIVLTGTREKTIIEYLKQSGAKQGTSVSKNTYMVIAKNKNDDTGKAEDARKLSIPILSVEEFIEKYVK